MKTVNMDKYIEYQKRMIGFTYVEKSMYRVVIDNASEPNKFKYISECSNINCIFTRSITDLRQRFEDQIVAECKSMNRVSLLFYSSFLLLNQLNIMKDAYEHVEEIHLVDYVYQDIFSSQINSSLNINDVIGAITEFSNYVLSKNSSIRIYIHTDPFNIKNNIMMFRRVDIVSAIDTGYSTHNYDDLKIIKEISNHVLKSSGNTHLSLRINGDVLCRIISPEHCYEKRIDKTQIFCNISLKKTLMINTVKELSIISAYTMLSGIIFYSIGKQYVLSTCAIGMLLYPMFSHKLVDYYYNVKHLVCRKIYGIECTIRDY